MQQPPKTIPRPRHPDHSRMVALQWRDYAPNRRTPVRSYVSCPDRPALPLWHWPERSHHVRECALPAVWSLPPLRFQPCQTGLSTRSAPHPTVTTGGRISPARPLPSLRPVPVQGSHARRCGLSGGALQSRRDMFAPVQRGQSRPLQSRVPNRRLSL